MESFKKLVPQVGCSSFYVKRGFFLKFHNVIVRLSGIDLVTWTVGDYLTFG